MTIIIPFRASNADRIRNLHTVLRYYGSRFQKIIVVEEDVTSKVNCSCMKLFLQSNSLFNKMRCLNHGVINSDDDVYMMLDVDVVLPHSVIIENETKIRYGKIFMQPFTEFVYMNYYGSNMFHNNRNYDALYRDFNNNGSRARYRMHDYTSIVNPGGCLLFSRTNFLDVGGGDMRFTGWGGEDDEIKARVVNLGYEWANLDSQVFHLVHPEESRISNKKNQSYVKAMLSLDKERTRTFVEQHRGSIFISSSISQTDLWNRRVAVPNLKTYQASRATGSSVSS